MKSAASRLHLRHVFRYWKPAGVLSTTLPCKDGQNILQHSPHLASYFAEITNNQIVVPIGRLDKASDGLLLLTTDPSLCARLLRPVGSGQVSSDSAGPDTGPGSPFSKEYHVTTTHRMPDEALARMRAGMDIRTRRKTVTTLPCVVERLPRRGVSGFAVEDNDSAVDVDGDSSRNLKFILKEGKNRQIRKMVGSFSHSVQRLTRVRFGSVTLEGSTGEQGMRAQGLRVGEAALLSDEEVHSLLLLNSNSDCNSDNRNPPRF